MGFTFNGGPDVRDLGSISIGLCRAGKDSDELLARRDGYGGAEGLLADAGSGRSYCWTVLARGICKRSLQIPKKLGLKWGHRMSKYRAWPVFERGL